MKEIELVQKRIKQVPRGKPFTAKSMATISPMRTFARCYQGSRKPAKSCVQHEVFMSGPKWCPIWVRCCPDPKK